MRQFSNTRQKKENLLFYQTCRNPCNRCRPEIYSLLLGTHEWTILFIISSPVGFPALYEALHQHFFDLWDFVIQVITILDQRQE